MTFQNIIEMVVQIFPQLGYTQVIKELDLAQKVFNNDTELLQTQYQLPSITTARTFALPVNFRKLKRVDFLTSTNEVVYGTGLIYDVSFNSITFDSTLETITTVPSAINKVIITYVIQPTTLTAYSNSFEIPEEYSMALFHKVMEMLHARIPTIEVQLTNGQINKQKDWNAVKYHSGEYKTLRIGAKRDVNSIDSTPFNISGVGYAGQSVNRVVSLSGAVSTVGSGSTDYSKYMRFTMVSGTCTINQVIGYATPTIVETLGTITVTSNAEFTASTFVIPNNFNTLWSYISSSEITLNPPSDYGTIVVEIWEK